MRSCAFLFLTLCVLGCARTPEEPVLGCTGGADRPPEATAGAVLEANFDGDPVGTFTVEQLQQTWPGTTFTNGVNEGRVEVVEESAANRFLRVRYPIGGVGPGAGGAQWKAQLGKAYQSLYVAYKLRFADGFRFVKGGKLPGLAGGTANTGGDKPTGLDGFSARMMWLREGRAIQYAYHKLQPGSYGENFPWNASFESGCWIQVEHQVVLNTPGIADGAMRGWMNGKPAFSQTGMLFRDAASMAVDVFYFSTFFGGSGSDWAPQRDEYIDFDDFVISESPITH